MINVLIIEDELPAVERITSLLSTLDKEIQITATLDSVERGIDWLKKNTPDLIFSDIQLADGMSFEIFETLQISCPIIFTTAFNQYAIKAFELNSIDYLLKPIDPSRLEKALKKFKITTYDQDDFHQLKDVFDSLKKQQFKERFLIKIGSHYKYLKAKEAAYFLSEGGANFLVNAAGERYIIDESLDSLEVQLSPKLFYRINRKLIISESCIREIHSYFNSRLKIDIYPKINEDVVVARNRVKGFKDWLSR